MRQHERAQGLWDRVLDAIVIGGGSAGLAAAVALAEGGAGDVALIEQEDYLGGVLVQCVHDGFGMHAYGESLTGPEYAQRWVRRLAESPVATALATTVVDASLEDGLFAVDAVGEPLGGRRRLRCRALVCATGCHERTRGSMLIPGTRPVGVYTAGEAQYMINVANQLPGDKVAILGSGDIGLIMARRLTLEGAEVRMVLGQEATGLLRNHIGCIRDYRIPIRYGWGIVSIHGRGRLSGIKIAPVRGDGSFDLQRSEYLRVNTLLIATGLIPERAAIHGIPPETPGLFVCGNADAPHDLVDQVSADGVRCALDVLAYLGCEAGDPAVPGDLLELAGLPIVERKGKVSDYREAAGSGTLLVCTECPTGCVITVDDGGAVAGNACERGAAYAARELACPMRVFTGTVGIRGADAGRMLLPVRSSAPVPLSEMRNFARACRRMTVDAPVAMGDVVRADVAGTGVGLVATSDAPAADVPAVDAPAVDAPAAKEVAR